MGILFAMWSRPSHSYWVTVFLLVVAVAVSSGVVVEANTVLPVGDHHNNDNVKDSTEASDLLLRRRSLETVTVKDVADPRSVEFKTQAAAATVKEAAAATTTSSSAAGAGTTNQRAVPFEGTPGEAGHTRPLRILAVGTSFTWAHGVPDRMQAYPYQITTHPEYVDNIALPATGADYPAICIESMIPKDADANGVLTSRNYDLIMLEFSENQTDGLRFLVKRIRDKYPKAVLLYVHVWAFIGEVTEVESGQFPFQLGLDATKEWQWTHNSDGVGFYKVGRPAWACIRELCEKEELLELIESPEIGGTVFFFPLPESPMTVINEGWLVEDWLHLSYVGHRKVAQGVVQFMKKHEEELYSDKDSNTPEAPQGTWNLGDTCMDWGYNRENVSDVEYTGAEMVCHNVHDPLNPDCSLEVTQKVGGDGAVLTFHSRFAEQVPVGIGYKSRQSPILYPSVSISVNGGPAKVVDPSYNRSTRTAAATRLKNSVNHIGAHYKVGWATPGENTITIHTLPPSPSPTSSAGAADANDANSLAPTALDPFRVTGIYMCGSCVDNPDGDFGMGSMNTELDALQPVLPVI
jgi:hypothetical protein